MTQSTYQIEQLSADAAYSLVAQVARLHRAEIPDGFLSSMGESFLTRLYAGLVANPDVGLWIARENDQVLGYLCATTSTGGVYRRFLLRNAWRVLPALMRKFVDPARVRRVWETLRYPAATQRLQLPEPEILNFCVSSAQQRRGIGRQLFAAMQQEFTRRRIPKIRIVTGEQQTSAQRFYESLGAQQVQQIELHSGVHSLVYVYDIAAAANTQPRAA